MAPAPRPSESHMVLLYSLMGGLVALLFIYLVIALLKPEIFP